MSDNALGSFIRARRDATPPAAVGLPAGERRRAPGLRRSELAVLADISVDYLVRLEQGRDRHPSQAVIGALSDALHLSVAERMHLRQLSKFGTGAACSRAPEPTTVVRPPVLAVIDQLEPGIALVLNRIGDILAHTSTFAKLAAPLGVLDSERPNLFAYTLTDERATTAFPDWAHVAEQTIAQLRGGLGHADPYVQAFIDDLARTVGAHFTDRLAAAAGRAPDSAGVTRWLHPQVGELRLAHERLELAPGDQQTITVLVPDDDASTDAVNRLRGARSGALRAVSS
ncbi:helix-turn-helix domain-containing protein [Luteipulveratus halotolerans]|uniref:DNA-binding protein n=1 Tax=Luteipulveratus halotolerans TaxID=1631356 RepID=A0A0L6CPZ3_9MICO|nr:helix-turn-helix transcriptional regulator [Luteipulveratus halotolerans]KNX39598.1 DNA-binding protein [Luteipulveratus halotolerans]